MVPVMLAMASTPARASTIPVKIFQPSQVPWDGISVTPSRPEKTPAAANPSNTSTAGKARYTAKLPASRGPKAFTTPKAKIVRIAQRVASSLSPK